MLFSSSIFIFLFLPLVIIGYYLLKGISRIYFLTFLSLLFYAWGEPKYVLIMLLSIFLNYVFGLLIYLSEGKGLILKKSVLILSVVCNLGILFYFKYLNFALSSFNYLSGANFPYKDIVMPIGISFFTFQGMSYVIDLYKKNVKVQKNPALIAFYISFFPQLIAGPIVRYIDIEDQITLRHESVQKFVSGIKRFTYGLAKKVILANTLGYMADQVFANPAIENTPLTAWWGVICYAFQIYYDFSGYSDMAIGLGRMFGFEFLENFNYPYISKTLTEFWRRWHISLSTWFRDYVYIPLGGNRTGNVYVNLLIVFFITGLWHGASVNFIVWGLWHGLFLIVERKFKLTKIDNKIFIPFRYALTMLVIIIGWVLFRADDIPYAVEYLGVMFRLVQPNNVGFTFWYYWNNKVCIALILSIIAAVPKPTIHISSVKLHSLWEYVSLALTLVLFFISSVFVVVSSYNPFIYFRF